ncbi:MAG: hypothetical protein K2Q18_12535 [Bdellovibrionales bacterium]|nr:hypothetical protein [Bdellovibrionales bacterium]
MKNLETASWDNSNIYLNLKDPLIEKDIQTILEKTAIFESKKAYFSGLITEVEQNNTKTLFKDLELVKELYRIYLDTNLIFHQIMTFASTSISVNTGNEEAKALLNRMSKLSSNYTKIFTPIKMCVLRSPVDFYSAFLDDDRTRELAFTLTKQRQNNDYLLSTNEEMLITGFSLDGINA